MCKPTPPRTFAKTFLPSTTLTGGFSHTKGIMLPARTTDVTSTRAPHHLCKGREWGQVAAFQEMDDVTPSNARGVAAYKPPKAPSWHHTHLPLLLPAPICRCIRHDAPILLVAILESVVALGCCSVLRNRWTCRCTDRPPLTKPSATSRCATRHNRRL